MSSIAEFYSRNLANEVIKGSVQKDKAGGTPASAHRVSQRAPDGERPGNPHHRGRPGTGSLMTWAFEAYANWRMDHPHASSMNSRPRPYLDARTQHAGQAARPTHLQRLLRNPYYMGIVRYRGVLYPGKHEPLVDPETWQKVQELLERPQHRRREAARTPPLPQRLGLLRGAAAAGSS